MKNNYSTNTVQFDKGISISYSSKNTEFSYEVVSRRNVISSDWGINPTHYEFEFTYEEALPPAINFLVDIFVNQRKLYRYKEAFLKYQEGLIDDDVFDKIEDSCTIKLQKRNTKELAERLVYFHDLLNTKAPEELDYLDDNDLSDILGMINYEFDNFKKVIKHAERTKKKNFS
jgi:hypothetical protein